MVFNATFNNISVISWRSVLLVEESGIPEESGLIKLKATTNRRNCYFKNLHGNDLSVLVKHGWIVYQYNLLSDKVIICNI